MSLITGAIRHKEGESSRKRMNPKARREQAPKKTTLKHRMMEMEIINAISQASARQLDFDALVEFAGEKIRATFNVQSVYIALLDVSANIVRVPYWVVGDERLPERRHDPAKGLNGHILRTRVPLLINRDYMRVSEELGVIRHATIFSPQVPKSWLGVPIFSGDQAIGVIAIVNYEHEGAFTDATAQFLTTLAASIANAFQNAQLYQSLQGELKERKRSEDELRVVNQELSARLEEIQLLQIKLRESSIRDALTGLFNRRYMEETLEREVARAKRENTSLSVVMMDLDEFKSLNDSYGHKAGDLMLERLGGLLLSRTRRSDVACRYGGEEFILLMPGASLADAELRAEEIRIAAQDLRVLYGGIELARTLSLGVAAYPVHGDSSDKIIAQADTMLYAAKHSGRNRVMVAPI
jgi:diguanylate cyclase (GGDEF)-like protein